MLSNLNRATVTYACVCCAAGMALGLACTAGAADMRCEWIGSPAIVTVWSPWIVTSPGTLWNTETRFCTTTWTGQATWFTTTIMRGSSAGFGASQGGGGSAGFNWTKNEVIIPGSATIGPGTAVQRVREESCVYTSTTVLSMNANLPQSIGSSSNLSNRWAGATVSWDGGPVTIDTSINLRGQVGSHAYVVSRTDGASTQTLNFNVSVTPDFTMSFLGYGDTPNGSAWMRFTNNSPDAIDTVLTSTSGWVGTSTDIANATQHVLAGSSVDVLVDFYTNPGYVVAPGDHPFGSISARVATTDGEVLVSAPVIVPAPGVAAALATLGGMLSARRHRQTASTAQASGR